MEAVMTGPGHPEADGAGQGHGIAQDLAALRHFDGAAFKKHRQPSVAPQENCQGGAPFVFPPDRLYLGYLAGLVETGVETLQSRAL